MCEFGKMQDDLHESKHILWCMGNISQRCMEGDGREIWGTGCDDGFELTMEEET